MTTRSSTPPTPIGPASDAAPRALLLVGLLLLVACKDDPPDARHRVADVVAASVRHESAMLTILETNREKPSEAKDQLVAYVARYRDELDGLAHQRSLLEAEPSAFADAVQANGARMAENLARRRRLLESSPTLMAQPEIKAALARLAAL